MLSQIVATILGFVLMFILIAVNIKFLKRLYLPIYIVSIALLILVLIIGTGDSVGARSWIKFGPISFQPSEFVKVIIILIIAYWIVEKYKNGINNLKDIIGSILPALPLILLILIQPDLGTTLITISAFLFMIFFKAPL